MCAVYTNDPVRVKITFEDIWTSFHPPKGIDSCWYPASSSSSSSQTKDEWFCQLATSDTNPFQTNEEHYMEDIERELAKLNIIQDHIREREPHTHFNPFKSREIEAPLDQFSIDNYYVKENRYDVLIDKALGVHKMQNGKLFGIIESG